MTQLLRDIFNHDFSKTRDAAEFSRIFFAKTLGLAELAKINAFVTESRVGTTPAAIAIDGKEGGDPFIILAQLHGNEPAGLAGILLAMALKEAGLLQKNIIGTIGNPLAASQYFEAWKKYPGARQETRDAFRCGLAPDGSLLPDGNRIPVDFLTRAPDTHVIKRPQELYALAQKSCGILDIHSARGNMVCITDHKHDSELKYSPIRAVLTGLAEAISVHASASVTVQTLKTILHPLPNIQYQVGIEAGTHEAPAAPGVAASFTLSVLYNLGFTAVQPLNRQENNIFQRYAVQPRITYADLIQEGTLYGNDKVYMGRMLNGKFVVGQYEEMEAIQKDQVVARAEPSGALFKAPFDFSGIFFSKSAALFDKDPAVGPWPVGADKLITKFCYPCIVSPWKIEF